MLWCEEGRQLQKLLSPNWLFPTRPKATSAGMSLVRRGNTAIEPSLSVSFVNAAMSVSDLRCNNRLLSLIAGSINFDQRLQPCELALDIKIL